MRLPGAFSDAFADFTEVNQRSSAFIDPRGSLEDLKAVTQALAGFGFGGGARYVGDSFADQANTLAVPSRALFDAALHYDYRQWRAALNVTNVADKIFVSSCDGVTSCFYGERRKAILSLAYRW